MLVRVCQALALVAFCICISVPCIGQISDSQLRSWVAAEYPAINNPSLSDWEKIQILREFSYKHTAQATSVDVAAYRAGEQYVNDIAQGIHTLGDGYSFFDNFGGGVVCGGTTTMLVWLFQRFGYPSWR